MWCIGELGLETERHDVGGQYGGLESAAFRKLNPNGTIPVLRDANGPPIWETGCILRYLASRYAPEPFWPTDLNARTHIDQWAEWAKINVALAFTGPMFWRVVRSPNIDQDAVHSAVATLEDKLRIADSRRSNAQYLAGDELSLADIQFGHILFRYYDIDIARTMLPNFKRYFTALTNRPAYAEHVMVSYEALRS